MCLLCLLPAAGCSEKDTPAPRVWCIKPSSAAAESELKMMLRTFDADAYLSFVPANELDSRLQNAMERDEAPDVFMVFSDSLPDLAEEKKLAEIGDRLRLSKIKADELLDSARRACVYQGKSWAAPLFTDVYMLATNRSLVSVAPQTVAQLKDSAKSLEEKGVSSFEKISPQKQSLLFEAALNEHGGKMLNSRMTRLEFVSPEGEAALSDLTEIFKSVDESAEAMGEDKAAYSVMTMLERRAYAAKYPDAEIELSPLLGVDRLQTVALAMSKSCKNQTRAFKILEFLQTESDKISALYKCNSAQKEIKAVDSDDEAAITSLSKALPAPDLCGYEALTLTYIPAAIEKAGKGVPAADCLDEAAKAASSCIWKGKRE